MAYHIKQIFYSLQGEGYHTGRPAVFCRFTGCNLWSGKEDDRTRAACRFCDTDILGVGGENGVEYSSPAQLADAIVGLWSEETQAPPFVVLTGGEPLLQVNAELLQSLRERNATIAIETNGTLPLPGDIDWVCVSPKEGTDVVLRAGDELKLVFPQDGLLPDTVEGWDFRHFYLQPLSELSGKSDFTTAIEYCLRYPHWRLSVQLHKLVGIK